MKTELIQIIAGFVGSLAFGLLFNLKPRYLFLSALGGAMSWTIFLLCGRKIESVFLCVLIASAITALYSEILAKILKAPATLFLLTGVIPLVPGGYLYHAMMCIVNHDAASFQYYGSMTGYFALGIAAGMSLIWIGNDMLGKFMKKYRRMAE